MFSKEPETRTREKRERKVEQDYEAGFQEHVQMQSLSKTIRNYEHTFNAPRSSNVGLIWGSGQVEGFKSSGEEITEESGGFGDHASSSEVQELSYFPQKADRNLRIMESQPLPKRGFFHEYGSIDRNQSLKSYQDGKLFKFLNRESGVINVDDFEAQIPFIEASAHEKMLEECYVSLYKAFEDNRGFFFSLINEFAQNVVDEYWGSPKYEFTLQKLIDSIKLFSSYLSSALFTMFEDDNRIAKGGFGRPEEIFISQIVYLMFNENLVSKKVKKRTVWFSLTDVIGQGLNLHHRETIDSFK